MTDDAIYDQLWHLAAHPDATIDLLALGPDDLHRFLAIARIHGVLGLVLSQAVDTTSGTGVTWENVRRAWKGEVVQSLRVRHHGQSVLDQLRQRGIPALLFKGPDFADHLYPDPRLRPTLDVDILVPREQWIAAIGVLEAMGHKEKPRQPHPVVPHGLISQRSWIFPMPGAPIEVDLQWSLIHFPFFRKQASIDYWDLDWQWLPGGQGMLAPASRLIIAAVHGVYHHQFDRLLQLIDLQKACAKVDSEVEKQKVRALAERTGTKLALDVALQVTARLLNDPAVEGLRQCILDASLPWSIPPGLFQDTRANLRTIHTSYVSPGAKRIRQWLMQQPMRPEPGWELKPPAAPKTATKTPSRHASPIIDTGWSFGLPLTPKKQT